MRRSVLAVTCALSLAVSLAACESTSSSDWLGGERTPFKQAERSCNQLLPGVSEEEDRREFFIGCMQALGWTPKPGASIEV